MTNAIRIENLSKSYKIAQNRGGAQRYVALRDVLTDGVRTFGRNILSPSRFMEAKPQSIEFAALQDINLDIPQGQKLAVIGPNGAGKSTLLKILSQITEPSRGRIEVQGRIASLLEVGTGFHPELTGRENIFLNGSILGMSHAEIRRKFDEIVDFSGVETFLDTPVKRYSSGMRVRLGFAVAAHLESEILVIDEVLAVGDAAFQRKCIGKMDDVARSEGRTILFVSHNMGAVRQLCTHGIVLEKGRVSFSGTSAEASDFYHRALAVQDARFPVISTKTLTLRGTKMSNVESGIEGTVSEGTPVRLSFLIDSTEEHKGAALNVTISGAADEAISLLSNRVTGERIDLHVGSNQIVCDVSDIPLVSGQYYLNVKVITAENEVLFAPRYRSFEMADGARGIGISSYKQWAGNVLLSQAWSQEDAN